ncbi:MipA/OmpV family protein [Bowmanella pacifica]|uniref:Outer membrane protein n=1 Tax=Bowmanella pacifica TaxID=502051 RepID=A0A918DIW9_9ALTE|nr:MipA/OmpV family protein [Bowmanella pacifica]GGO68665.1 outer membrane protein [Bowmanella pacifica]
MPIRTVALCIAMAGSMPAFADGQWGLGVGVITATSPYLGESSDTFVVPLVSYDSENFHFSGVSASYDLYEDQAFKFAAFVRPGFDFFDPDEADTDYMRSLKERKFSVLAGVRLETDLGFANSSLSVANDITGNAKGFSLEAALNRQFVLAKGLMLKAELGVVYADDKTIDYYYGVDGGESAYFPAYSPDGALNPYLSATLMYQLDANWQLFSNAKWTEYDSEIKDSPIVGRDRDLQIMAALSYKF